VRSLGRLKVLRFYSVGEPLLNKNLGRMIRHAFDQRVAERSELTTNATALIETQARELLDSGLSYLRISIYEMTDERHVRVTGSKVPVARILENVRRFRRLRNECGLGKAFRKRETCRFAPPLGISVVSPLTATSHALRDEPRVSPVGTTEVSRQREIIACS
jgi:hypothetical protein